MRFRTGLVIGLSAAGHLAVLALLALTHPQLSVSQPPPVMEVQIVPVYAPRKAEPAPTLRPLAAQPIRPRRSVRQEEAPSIAPLVTPNAPAPAEAPGPWRLAPPGPEAPPAASPPLRNALRGGTVGCANPGLLSKEERAACQEKLGAGAKDAPFIPPAMSADKRKAFDAAAARKDANRRYRDSNMPVGTVGGGLGEPTPTTIPIP